MTDSNGKDFRERLKTIRELSGLTQSELAQKTELQPAHISHFETGERLPSFGNLCKLCHALKISANYLLGIPEYYLKP